VKDVLPNFVSGLELTLKH